MRTDAIMINLPEGDRMHKQMDRSKGSADSFLPGFATHQSGEKKANFAEVYSKVAKSNHKAKQITDKNVPPFKESVDPEGNQLLTAQVNETVHPAEKSDEIITTDAQQEDKTNNRDESDIHSILQQCILDDFSMRPQNLKVDAQRAAQASEVVIGAIKKIAETLNINIMQGMDSLSLQTVSQENVKQFAEIVSVLKSITEVLDETVRQGLPLDTGRTVMEVEEASQAANILRSELFKVELALNMLGIAEQVQSASGMAADVSVWGGIPLARNPDDLSMPLEQIQRIFGDLIEDFSQGKKIDDKLSMKFVQNVNEPVKDVTIGSFDAGTYRTILKLEKKEIVENENVESADSLQNLKIPANSDPAVAINVSDVQTEVDESISVLQSTSINLRTNQTVPIETRISSALQRTTEDSVMNQLTSKMHHLVRSGENEIRIQLRPESLGEVKLAIRMEGDIVAARIQVENQQVKQIVESNLQLLRDALSEQNLQAGAFEVNVGNGWEKQSDQPYGSHANKSGADDSDSISGSDDDIDSVKKVNVGIETGQRYGNNSIEYYA